MIRALFIVGVGGFIGSVLRYLTSLYFQSATASPFPWGTFAVNISGSLLIGIFYGLSEKGNLMPADLRLFLTVGLCGGFTTFSSFSNDAFILMQGREWLRVSLYASMSFFVGLLAVFIGRTLVKLI